MKIKKISDTDYIVYLFDIVKNDDNVYEKAKELIKNIQKKLKIKGFYRMRISINSIGVFIKLIKLDDSFYNSTLDLKIESVDEDIYVKTEDYFLIKNFSRIIYFDGYYYALLNDSFDKILEKVEFCEFLLTSEIDKVLKLGSIV